jgi:hypothetical protein
LDHPSFLIKFGNCVVFNRYWKKYKKYLRKGEKQGWGVLSRVRKIKRIVVKFGDFVNTEI